MKKLIALTSVALVIASSARAQWIVYDPSATIQSVLNTAQEIAKFVEVVNNQVQQINSLREQLNSFNHYKELFGDPSKTALNTVAVASADLLKKEAGENLNVLVEKAEGAKALTYDSSSLYVNVSRSFPTLAGNVPREADNYRPYAAVNQATANYVAVSTNATARRVALKAEIQQNIQALKDAKTDAEVQKLAAGLTALSSALNSVDHEVNQSLASALVQDIENRNDERKQEQAVKEQRQAEFRQALTNYNAKFPLMTAPARFPADR